MPPTRSWASRELTSAVAGQSLALSSALATRMPASSVAANVRLAMRARRSGMGLTSDGRAKEATTDFWQRRFVIRALKLLLRPRHEPPVQAQSPTTAARDLRSRQRGTPRTTGSEPMYKTSTLVGLVLLGVTVRARAKEAAPPEATVPPVPAAPVAKAEPARSPENPELAAPVAAQPASS